MGGLDRPKHLGPPEQTLLQRRADQSRVTALASSGRRIMSLLPHVPWILGNHKQRHLPLALPHQLGELVGGPAVGPHLHAQNLVVHPQVRGGEDGIGSDVSHQDAMMVTVVVIALVVVVVVVAFGGDATEAQSRLHGPIFLVGRDRNVLPIGAGRRTASSPKARQQSRALLHPSASALALASLGLRLPPPPPRRDDRDVSLAVPYQTIDLHGRHTAHGNLHRYQFIPLVQFHIGEYGIVGDAGDVHVGGASTDLLPESYAGRGGSMKFQGGDPYGGAFGRAVFGFPFEYFSHRLQVLWIYQRFARRFFGFVPSISFVGYADIRRRRQEKHSKQQR
mmetsp:Transcript_53149/g.159062  ORF Transcript_53149/g.159062 Transcript_53149/m.159062 type:complete len:335 (+) Transcript_53149:268-1272(+)